MTSGATQQALTDGYSAAGIIGASIQLPSSPLASLILSDQVNAPDGEEETATLSRSGTVRMSASS